MVLLTTFFEEILVGKMVQLFLITIKS